MRYYLYKMTSDYGAAPCVCGGVLSLAICKPRIRSAAGKDDVVIGFAGMTLGDGAYAGRIIYIAKITEKLECGDYYRANGVYVNRCDQIYEWKGETLVQKVNRWHNADSVSADIGSPPYNKANVLVSGKGKFRCLRHKAWPKEMGCEIFKTLGRSHRVNHDEATLKKIEKIVDRAFKEKDSAQDRVPLQSESLARCAGKR